ncbi:hypothetical protein AC579_4926 [Pseudocercospora musae]|uniref:Uncharacterized protein n=1 Tax=Pseudocercospora musae TaxID=113226 RepID=A0A139I245_9PEZI|nr:hypothetical protein AC579_4926 [Pseudocercospora musae]
MTINAINRISGNRIRMFGQLLHPAIEHDWLIQSRRLHTKVRVQICQQFEHFAVKLFWLDEALLLEQVLIVTR